MNKRYIYTLALLLAAIPGWMAAQESESSDTKIIIIEEKVDAQGNKTVTKTVREGNFDDAQIEKIIAEESVIQKDPAQKKGYLGVMIDNAPAGVRITEVIDDSPAAKAGLVPGDVITAVNGVAVNSIEGLVSAVSSHAPGESVDVRYLREGSAESVLVGLAERQQPEIAPDVFGWDEHVIEQNEQQMREHERAMEQHDRNMEAHERDMAEHERQMQQHERDIQRHDQDIERNEQRAREMEERAEHHAEEMERRMESRSREDRKPRLGVSLGAVEAGPGVRVTAVTEGSVAASAGLQEGDVITTFNGSTINSADDLIQAVRMAPADKKVSVEYLRAGKKLRKKVVLN